MTHRSPQVGEWFRESERAINMPFFNRYLHELEVAEQRTAGDAGLPTFEERARPTERQLIDELVRF